MWTALIAPITNIIGNWQNNRAKKQERKDKIEDAKVTGEITRIAKLAEGGLDYDVEAQRQMQYSWKDEYLVIVLSLPFIFSFIPVAQDYVITGWQYLQEAPDWYQWAWLGVISATFGLRMWSKRK